MKALASASAIYELAKALPEATLLLSREGEILAANPPASSMLGLSAKKLREKYLHELTEDPPEEVKHKLKVWSRTRTLTPGSLSLIADGRVVDCRCDGAVIQPPSENPSTIIFLRCVPKAVSNNRFLALNRELETLQTEHRKVSQTKEYLEERVKERTAQLEHYAEELKKSGARFRSLVQRGSDIITILELDGTIRYQSPVVERILGYRPEEMIGKNAFDYVHPDDLEVVLSAFVEGLANPELHPSAEYRSRHKDGSWRYVESVGSNLLDDPNVGELVINSRDITERKLAEEALRESERRLRAIVGNVPVILFVLDRDGVFTLSEGKGLRGLGLEPGEVVGRSVLEVYRDVPEIHEHVRHALDGEEVYAAVEVGEAVFEAYYEPLRDEGEVVGIIGVARDITERKRAEKALRASEANLAEAQQIAHLGSWEYDAEKDRMYWSDEMYRIFGFSPQQFVPRLEDFLDSIHPDDRWSVREYAANLPREGQQDSIEHRIVRPDGEVRFVQNQRRAEHDAMGTLIRVTGTVQDITERKTLEERLTHQALHDPLTGLPNRTLFMDRLEHALASTERRENKVAVLFIDLDNFKIINDSLGHGAGDQLLPMVAGRMEACLRLKDTIARFGGDEFTILLEGVGAVSDAVQVANRIIEELQVSFALEEKEVFISPSIGIALSSTAVERAEDLLRNADTALYRAKSQGKARCEVFDPSMYAGALKRLKLESDLRRALEQDKLKVYYQPEVTLDVDLRHSLRVSGNQAIIRGSTAPAEAARIVGMEALVRWEHPELGLIPPDEFVPIAEESGLIVPMGQWVLREACYQVRRWHEQYPSYSPLIVSVNLSPKQFQHLDLAQSVAQVLRETGLDPNSLCLEVTESGVMRNVQTTITTLRELEDLGVQLAIDDFGTGYSSLSYLKRFPINYLKIDRSFIKEFEKDDEDATLVSGIIQLVHTLGMKVIAEGVENAEQLARLRGLGCDQAQGYYFSEPLPAEAASALLASLSGS